MSACEREGEWDEAGKRSGVGCWDCSLCDEAASSSASSVSDSPATRSMERMIPSASAAWLSICSLRFTCSTHSRCAERSSESGVVCVALQRWGGGE